ncbi:MAG: carbonic anhydrase [Acidimicrobiia bacterium]|nr:carbonic anhydrase [Acidimicrobiia bacterium]
MPDLTTIYERNAAFADGFDQSDLVIKPRIGTIVLTCVDARVDPAHFSGLELGDALVMRTVGGRVTDTAMLEVAMLWQLMKLGAGGKDPNLGLAIIHHNDCGMAKFAVPAVAAAITSHFGTGDVVETYAIGDERTSVAADVDRAMNSTYAPSGLIVSGHRYDITTGKLEQVVAPAPVG